MFFPMFFARTTKNHKGNMVHVFDQNSDSDVMYLTIVRHWCDNVTDGRKRVTLQIHDWAMESGDCGFKGGYYRM